MLYNAQLQGADLRYAQLQGAVLNATNLAGVQLSDATLDYVLILEPIVDWKKSDDNLLSKLRNNSSAEENKVSKTRLLAAIKRMENAKDKPLPDLSMAKLDKQEHRCLLLSDNAKLQKSAQHLCDNANDPLIDPLIHLRKWSKYNAQVHCKHKRSHYFVTRDGDIRNAYNIVKNYRTPGKKYITPEKASKAIYKLAQFLYNKQLIQIHQDKTMLCDARPELDAWYNKAGYKNDPDKRDRILNLKLEPFPTSTEH